MLPDFVTVQVESNDMPKIRQLLLGKGNLMIHGQRLTIQPSQQRLLDQAGIRYEVVEPESS